jgi:hypothetical protein
VRRARALLFYVATTCLVGVASYACLEGAVRVLHLPDPLLLRDIERELASPSAGVAASSSPKSVYGWDSEPIACPEDSGPAGVDSSTAFPIVLFVGDSITRGYGVDQHTQSYPMLLCHMASRMVPVRIVNAAVEGFGVDQMIMKLEDTAPHHQPDLIVFAYIPHDLWRPGRHVHFGATKPVMTVNRAGWQIVPAPNTREFYESYSAARSRYYLSIWTIGHVAANRRYYLPRVYAGYYRGLFREIRRRLIGLAQRHGTEVLVVRLASNWPGAAVRMLDRMATDVFSPSMDSGSYRYHDTEECVRRKAVASSVNYTEEFKYHPGPNGHRIYADCLGPILKVARPLARQTRAMVRLR